MASTRKEIDYEGVLKKFKWTAETYEYAQRFNFPVSFKRQYTHAAGGGIKMFWFEDKLDAWADQLRHDYSRLAL